MEYKGIRYLCSDFIFHYFWGKTAVVKIAELIQGRVEAQSQEETDVTAEEETEKTQTFRERHRLQLICSISMNIQDPGLHLKNQWNCNSLYGKSKEYCKTKQGLF